MKLNRLAMMAAAVVAFTAQVQAATIFLDNFNSENGGVGALNYTGFANWSVSAGTVDLIGNGFFDFYPGNGLYVDLDGSSGLAGTLISKSFALGAGSYVLSFDLGGSQRGDVNTVDVNVDLGVASQTYVVNSADPLTTRTIAFILASPQTIDLSFHNLGGDNVGAILDNVSLTVPEGGATAVLLGLGLAGLGIFRRNSRC